MLEVQAEEEGWITDDQHAANAWWDSQFDDIPFWVPGVMLGDRIPLLSIASSGDGHRTTTQHHDH